MIDRVWGANLVEIFFSIVMLLHVTSIVLTLGDWLILYGQQSCSFHVDKSGYNLCSGLVIFSLIKFLLIKKTIVILTFFYQTNILLFKYKNTPIHCIKYMVVLSFWTLV